MRFFEIVILAFLVIASCAVMFRIRLPRRTAVVCGLVALALFSVHALAEGTRWQMVPAYLLLVFVTLVILRFSRRGLEKQRRGFVRKIASGFIRFVVLPVTLAVACFVPWAVPIFELPDPSGPHGIGVSQFKLDYPDRPEIFTADEGDHRELMVRVWYPADVASGSSPAPYLAEEEIGPLSEVAGPLAPVPWFFNHLPLITTHSYRDADVAAAPDRFPVLAFSHGYTSFDAQNTPLMEELASHGYVVFSIAHTYEGAVLFPDGRSPGVGEHIERWNDEMSEEEAAQEFEEWEELRVETDPRTRRAGLERMIAKERENKAERVGPGLSWDVWVEDRVRFFGVLDDLESGARPSPFAGRLDLDRVGLFGMSFGGATAVEVCHLEPGCRAAINLDGGHMSGVDSTLLEGESSKPLMMLYSSDGTYTVSSPANADDFQAFNDFYYEAETTKGLRNDVIRIRVDGTSHLFISDFSMMIRGVPGLSSITPGERIAEILNRYSLAFFDEYVKREGSRSPLLDGPVAEFPEVTFQTFGHGFEDR
jgi:hypothetical protein